MSICITCGSILEDPEYGCCINGHDDWLELRDFKSDQELNRVGDAKMAAKTRRRARAKFQMTDEQLKDKLRKAKSLKSLLDYGASNTTIAKEVGITKEEASELIQRFNKAYPEVRRILDKHEYATKR